jgi:hypothetical protein
MHTIKEIRRFFTRSLPVLALSFLFLAANAFAQGGRIRIEPLDHLTPKASETVEVTVDGSLLQVAARFLNANKPDEAIARELLSALQGVYVRSFQFEQDNSYTPQDIELIRSQLTAPGWSKVAAVRSRGQGDNVDVHFMIEGTLITGIAVLVAEPRQLTIVNVVGPIDPEKISQLGLLEGRLGIPRLNLDWNVKRQSTKE